MQTRTNEIKTTEIACKFLIILCGSHGDIKPVVDLMQQTCEDLDYHIIYLHNTEIIEKTNKITWLRADSLGTLMNYIDN